MRFIIINIFAKNDSYLLVILLVLYEMNVFYEKKIIL